jgi:hypothetical protein
MAIAEAVRPLRVTIGEDDVLLREGTARISTGAGLDVVAQSGIGERPGGVRYFLKERVGDVAAFIDAVTKHVTVIFRKLDIEPADTGNRRVQAVLAYLHHHNHPR